MANVSFKVFFTIDDVFDEYKEIRRFQLIRKEASNYDSLRNKIRELFPDIGVRDFVIQWKDHEGDKIVISTNEELQIAISESSMSNPDALIKLYAFTKPKQQINYQTYSESAAGQNAPKMQHTDVICDVCNKEIHGFRYKCLQCPDYDLCKDCENKCYHPEHFMIRIPIPLQWKTYYGRKVSHLLNKFMKKASSCPMEFPIPEATPQCSHPSKKEKKQNNQCSPWWLDSCTAYLSDWTNISNGILLPEHSKKVTEGCESHKLNDATEATTSTNKNNPEDKRLEFLKTISENISQFLDPLGIDINVQMKADKPTQSTNVPQDNENQNNDKGNFCPFNVVRNDNADNKLKETDESSKKEDSASVASTSNASSVGQASNSNDTLKNDEWTLLDSENIPTTGVDLENPTATMNNTAPIPNTVIPDVGPSPVTAPTNVYQATNDVAPSLYPTLPADMNSFWHKDLKIQNAVATMMKMGFTNEGGWLTRLLMTTNGDINKAMDYITQQP